MDRIKTDFTDGCLTVFVECDVDHHNAAEIRQAVDREIGKLRPKLVILNFDAVEFMDSSGIGLIMGRYKLMKASGGDLKVSALNPRCRKLVEISGISQLVAII